MAATPNEILKQYWGYDSFRPLQEDIIRSVLDGKDTLALLPTGGGKSICFQVPALCLPGLCIVVIPLIALMIDQVANLKKRGIPAAEIHSGMHPREIRLVYEKCMEGRVSFLYLSPERLDSVSFREIALHLNPSLIAVDEAHCISQWGYDFRPPYLKIADVRQLFPDVPILALTATAVTKVVSDIQEKLNFRVPNVFRKSFKRENLAYLVYREEDKYRKLLKICEGVQGVGIVYVRNRRLTKETAEYLNHKGIRAGYYHAGLDPAMRARIQSDWMEEKIRVVVATNAFGMGIDKPNVRFVVHLDLPDTLEAYFQEAGRAGRDEKKAYAAIIFQESDILDARHFVELSWPEPPLIRQVYQALGNYFQLAVGSGIDMVFDFDIEHFSSQYRFKPLLVFTALKILEREGYLALSESMDAPSKLMFLVDKNVLYKFQVENREADKLVKVLLRSYSGLFSDFIEINEYELARRLSADAAYVTNQLRFLDQAGIIEFIPRKSGPQLTFVSERLKPEDIELSRTFYFDRKKDAAHKLEEMIAYVTMEQGCRNIRLLDYFGDTSGTECGVCDLCLARKKDNPDKNIHLIRKRLRDILILGPLSLTELLGRASDYPEGDVLNTVRWMADTGELTIRLDQVELTLQK